MINRKDPKDLRPDVYAVELAFVARMAAKGRKVAFASVYRDDEYQAVLYAQGRTTPGQIVTYSKVTTFHGVKLAFDFYQDAPTFKEQWQDEEFYDIAWEILKDLGFSSIKGERAHAQWDEHGAYTGAMVRSGQLPPPMPLYTEDKTTSTSLAVKGTTANETKLIKAIQSVVGAAQDGVIGTQTLSDIACKLKAITTPLTLKIYGMPVLIAKDIVPIASPGKGLSAFPNSINGGFYMMQAVGGGVPVSICVTGGVVKRQYSCHYPLPESVLYRRTDGVFGITRVKSTDELPKVSWAVGGFGLLGNYNPDAEGFKGQFSDVLRDTNHAMLGVKNGYCYLVYCASMTGPEVNAFAKKLNLDMAVMLDGGHIAGMNGSEDFAKINTEITQYYVIQAI